MIHGKTLALLLAAVGLLLMLGGPFLPGGLHLTLSGPPGGAHVTSFIATPKGDVLAGTEGGQVWRFRAEQWTREHLNLGDQPVLALLDNPRRTPVGTAAGLAHAPPGAPSLEGRISCLLQTDKGLLAGTAQGVRLLANGTWKAPGPVANVYTLRRQRRGDGEWLHAGTIGAGVLSAPAAVLSAAWQPNNLGLPDTVKVFSFATTRGGLLLAGTDQGLFWQPAPEQPWRSLHPALDGKRVLSLLLVPGQSEGAQRLWIGGDHGLSSLLLVKQGETLRTEENPQPADSPQTQLPVGISGIVSVGDRLMVSAGAVYEYGPTRLPGWQWISLSGVLLLLIAGRLMPPQEMAPADEGRG
jgi:hypothetical protein